MNIIAILTSLIGFLQWGKDNSVFLYQAEADVLSKLFSNPVDAMHPFTILPLIGQLLLVVTLFQKEPGKWLTFIGVSALSLLLGFMFLIGLLGLNIKIIASTIPFLMTAVLIFRYHRNKSKESAIQRFEN